MLALLPILLAAPPPPVPQVPAPSPPDSLTGLYVLVGAAVVGQLIAGLVGLFRWLGNRAVEREDADRKALQSENEKLRALIEKLREDMDTKFEEADSAVNAMDKSVSNMARDVTQMRDTFTQLKVSVDGITSSMESRIDKQGQFYREEVLKHVTGMDKKFEELEYRMRADATRAMRDAQALSGKKR